MSFGFGNNNNNTGSTGFGGFGASNTGGFGANNNTATTSGGSLFGGNTATTGGFGFGANNQQQQQSNLFGANKPGFGASTTATSGGGLFGANTSTSGGFGGGTGGFGNTANTSSGFGGTTTGGGLFGQNKTAAGGFGASTTGGSLFGGGSNTGGFGTNTGTTASNPFAVSSNAGAAGFGQANTGSTGFGGGFGTSTPTTNNGTATIPFQSFQEKEQAGTGMQAFQSITFQDPYKNQSFEELRVQDYAQGRRYGNTNGQAGAFGQSTGFGGTGQNNATSTGGGLFGNNTATAGTGFGGGFGNNSNTATNNSFGGNTGGGLFGQNKPAVGGLFGNSTATPAPATNSFGGTSTNTGGLFGNSGNGFGANAGANTTNTGGGLFGNTNNQQQNTNPFGGAPNTGGGLFGQQNKPAVGGLFGNTATNTANTGGGLFGSTNNQQQSNNAFGGAANTGGGLFGNTQQNQNKPAGALGGFGQTANTGGAFGNTTNTGGGLFGNTNNQPANTGGGLFGAQNKPATGSLFGGTNTNTGGGLFGNNQQQQQNTGSSLFGNTNNAGGGLFGNQNKPATGGLFGNSTASNTGGGLFGNSQSNQNTNTGSSLFGNTNQNQQNQSSSLFGSTNGQQQQQQQPNQLHASLTGAPYGNEQLFASLATSNPPVGPLATPLNSAKPAPRKTPSLMASMRLNSPVYTPRGGSIGRNAGYGFSYSTYGTPGSAYTGSLTPGASSLLRPTGSFGSALSSRLNKSISMRNLRGDGTPGESRSLLRESALSPPGSAAGRYAGGSVRKLNIDRSLRTDLFGPAKEPEQPSRKARYDNTAEQPDETSRRQPRNEHNALVRTESDDTEQEQEPTALIKAGPKPSGPPRQPEMSQVNNPSKGALSSVPEDDVPQRPGSAPATQQKAAPMSTGAVMKDNEPGEYWTQPALRDLRNMSRQQLQKIGKFVVGRHGIGRVEFGPCDLSTTQLDDLCGGIVRLIPRSATVYQDDKDKPAMGRALNVPSTIFLENSWPRSHGGRKAVHAKEGREYEKHIARLKKVGGTHFVDYNAETGVWRFTVEHFTTYGLDDEDDDEEENDSAEQGNSSGLSDAPVTPPGPGQQEDQTMQSIETGTSEQDDTFQFQLDRRSQMSVPGAFDEPSVSYDYDDPSADEQMDEDPQEQSEAEMEHPLNSSGGPVQAPSPGTVERYHSSMLEDVEESGHVDMTGVEVTEDEVEPEMPGAFAPEPKMLRSILKPSRGRDTFASPAKLAVESWEEQLQRTISPRKQDRLALREMQQSCMESQEHDRGTANPFKMSLLGRSTLGQSALGQSYLAQKSAKKERAPATEELGRSQAFRTSMDIMNSLWTDPKGGRERKAGKGFEYPYAKKPRLSAREDNTTNLCLKPSFCADGTIVYAIAGSAPQVTGDMVQTKLPIVGEHSDVRFAKLACPPELANATFAVMMEESATVLKGKDGELPSASTNPGMPFAALAQQVVSDSASGVQEAAIWQLCSTLFDPLQIAVSDIDDLPKEHWDAFASRLRLDALKAFWVNLVSADVDSALKRTKSAEEKAVLLLTRNDVPAACNVLVAAKNFRLASLVAQLPASAANRQVMQRQIDAWQKRKDWSEMSDAVRALYSIFAGSVCRVAGQSGASEDRASEFCVAERFAMTWRQSLGLRVYFGGHETLEEAVEAYCVDLETGRETVEPASPHGNGGEDTLLTLCRLYASEAGDVDAAVLCEPTTVSGSALNPRVAWQLSSLLSAKGLIVLPENKLASITLDLAATLETSAKLVESVWVLLHLGGAERQRAISGLLQRNARDLADVEEQLVQECRIPPPMISAARSLHAKAVGDTHGQVQLLLRAGNLAEAHEVLCTTVGPQAVIERDHDALALVSEFPRQRPAGWDKGGQIYEAYMRLALMSQGQKQSEEGEKVVRALRRGLRGVEEAGMQGKTLEQRVAVLEMRRFVEQIAKARGDERRMGKVEDGGVGAGAAMLDKYRSAVGLVL
ncbi:hypothetical protein LTS02_009146 [Friedmanniomyces endolithicus]|nr:hypothetical protein LTS02_009146 [Friedmanniomyces endolithicus]